MHGTLELRLLVINFHLLLMHQTAFYKIENRTHFIMIKHNLTQDNIKKCSKDMNLVNGVKLINAYNIVHTGLIIEQYLSVTLITLIIAY